MACATTEAGQILEIVHFFTDMGGLSPGPAHQVEGFTKLNSIVPKNIRGSFAGFAPQEIIDCIKSLGVSSVELLPIHSFVNDCQLLKGQIPKSQTVPQGKGSLLLIP